MWRWSIDGEVSGKWVSDQANLHTGDLVASCSGDEAARSHRRAVGRFGRGAACGVGVWAAAEVEQTAVDRWDPLVDPGWCTMAGCASGVCAVADVVLVVP